MQFVGVPGSRIQVSIGGVLVADVTMGASGVETRSYIFSANVTDRFNFIIFGNTPGSTFSFSINCTPTSPDPAPEAAPGISGQEAHDIVANALRQIYHDFNHFGEFGIPPADFRRQENPPANGPGEPAGRIRNFANIAPDPDEPELTVDQRELEPRKTKRVRTESSTRECDECDEKISPLKAQLAEKQKQLDVKKTQLQALFKQLDQADQALGQSVQNLAALRTRLLLAKNSLDETVDRLNLIADDEFNEQVRASIEQSIANDPSRGNSQPGMSEDELLVASLFHDRRVIDPHLHNRKAHADFLKQQQAEFDDALRRVEELQKANPNLAQQKRETLLQKAKEALGDAEASGISAILQDRETRDAFEKLEEQLRAVESGSQKPGNKFGDLLDASGDPSRELADIRKLIALAGAGQILDEEAAGIGFAQSEIDKNEATIAIVQKRLDENMQKLTEQRTRKLRDARIEVIAKERPEVGEKLAKVKEVQAQVDAAQSEVDRNEAAREDIVTQINPLFDVPIINGDFGRFSSGPDGLEVEVRLLESDILQLNQQIEQARKTCRKLCETLAGPPGPTEDQGTPDIIESSEPGFEVDLPSNSQDTSEGLVSDGESNTTVLEYAPTTKISRSRTAVTQQTFYTHFNLREWRHRQTDRAPLVDLPGIFGDERFNLFSSIGLTTGRSPLSGQRSVTASGSGGFSWQARPNLSVGMAARFGTSRIESARADIDATTWGIAGFAQTRIQTPLMPINLDGLVAYSRSDLDSRFKSANVTTTAEPVGHVFATQLSASTSYEFDPVTFSPSISLSYNRTNQESFLLSDGQVAPGSVSNALNLSAGLSVGADLETVTGDLVLSPSIGLALSGALNKSSDLSFSATAGLGIRSRHGITGNAGIGYSLSPGQVSSYRFSARLAIPLN